MKNTRPNIIRAPHDKLNPYFIHSRIIAQNKDLSWAARGVLAYLLSKPDDWQLDIRDLQQGCGRDKVYAILDELENAGHIRREQAQDDKGKFNGFAYFVYEHPFTENPDTDKGDPLTVLPYTVLPLTENPQGTYKREEQNRESTNTLSASETAKALPTIANAQSVVEDRKAPIQSAPEPVQEKKITPTDQDKKEPIPPVANTPLSLQGKWWDSEPMRAMLLEKARQAYLSQNIPVAYITPGIERICNGSIKRWWEKFAYPGGSVEFLDAVEKDARMIVKGAAYRTQEKAPQTPPNVPTAIPTPSDAKQTPPSPDLKGSPKPQAQRPRDPAFDAIALGSFGLSQVRGKIGSRVAGILKEIKECTVVEHLPTLASDLVAMYDWRKKVYPTLSAPTQGLTICKYLAEWRAAFGLLPVPKSADQWMPNLL